MYDVMTQSGPFFSLLIRVFTPIASFLEQKIKNQKSKSLGEGYITFCDPPFLVFCIPPPPSSILYLYEHKNVFFRY